jgi:ATP-dependent DNA ligase
MVIWCILWSFVVIFPFFGILLQEQSGNPGSVFEIENRKMQKSNKNVEKARMRFPGFLYRSDQKKQQQQKNNPR